MGVELLLASLFACAGEAPLFWLPFPLPFPPPLAFCFSADERTPFPALEPPPPRPPGRAWDSAARYASSDASGRLPWLSRRRLSIFKGNCNPTLRRGRRVD